MVPRTFPTRPRSFRRCAILGAGALLMLSGANGSVESVRPRRPCASLVLANRTDRPIYVYLDGRFVTRCEAMSEQVVRSFRLGNITALGRFRCDTWGPEMLTLTPDAPSRWILREPCLTRRDDERPHKAPHVE